MRDAERGLLWMEKGIIPICFRGREIGEGKVRKRRGGRFGREHDEETRAQGKAGMPSLYNKK